MSADEFPMTRAEHHTVRRYEVRHTTTYDYADDVTASFGRACLRPRECPTQRVLEHRIEISPNPDVLDEAIDLFGNPSHYFEVHTPHTRLVVAKNSVIEVNWPLDDLRELDRWTVAQAAAQLPEDPQVDPVEWAAFRLPSPLVTLDDVVRDHARTMLWDERPLGEAIAAVCHEIYTGFTYAKGATTVRTTLPELLATRAGVCQDFAHLAIACFRAVGLPARYVSGYIETQPPPGRPKLAGSDATHAWCSVMVPGGGWIDIDPTNDHLADSRYLVTAGGRDYRDVSPLKGIIFTEGSGSRLSVAVDVLRLGEDGLPLNPPVDPATLEAQ